jgi:hypothetical protein
MDFFIKSLYSVLFGLLAYLVLLIFSEGANDKKKLEISFLILLAIIVAINLFSIAPRFVPSSEIWELIVFDFAVPTLYVMMQRGASTSKDNRPWSLSESASFSHFLKSRNSILLRLCIIMAYIYQLVSIWFLTEHFLVKARWH